MWRTWKPGDKEWVATRLEVEPSRVALFPEGWIILRDAPWPGSWNLFRYGYGSEDGWQLINYGQYTTRLQARRAMDPEYRDGLRKAEWKLYELGIPAEEIDSFLEE